MAEEKPEPIDSGHALSSWEQKNGDTPDIPPHPRRAHLSEAFAAHPDVCTLQSVLDAAMNDAADPVPVMIEVQPGLLALLAHIGRLDAARAGRPPESPPRLLSQMAGNHLEHLLHTLVTDPTSHPHFAEAWNQLCEAEGAPELAVSIDAATDRPSADHGPF
jgi:hypothetical protein